MSDMIEPVTTIDVKTDKHEQVTYVVTVSHGDHLGEQFEHKDRGMALVNAASALNVGVEHDTFISAMHRPWMVAKYAAAKINHGYFPGAETTLANAADEIDLIVAARARGLGMTVAPVVVDADTKGAT